MRIIQFKSVQDDGTIKIVGTAKMVDGKVVITTSQPGLKKSINAPIMSPFKHKEVMPSDGIDWLEALPVNYNGSRFFAEEVEVK